MKSKKKTFKNGVDFRRKLGENKEKRFNSEFSRFTLLYAEQGRETKKNRSHITYTNSSETTRAPLRDIEPIRNFNQSSIRFNCERTAIYAINESQSKMLTGYEDSWQFA